MESIITRLRSAILADAINGDDYERHICGSLMKEAAREIEIMKIHTQDISEKYYELINAVATKHPDETRHETALRYINNVENFVSGGKEGRDHKSTEWEVTEWEFFDAETGEQVAEGDKQG